MSEDDSSQHIWSEFFRVKNRLMDYDENLRDAVANIRMLQKLNYHDSKLRVHYAKAQKHVGLVLDLALGAGAIPRDAKEEDIHKISEIAKGKWKGVQDFEQAQEMFREWYRQTKFYDVTFSKDNRPAVVRKYGKAARFG